MEITKEQQKDIDKRIEEFLKQHDLNVKEHEIDFAMLPQHLQIAQGIYATQVKAVPVDLKYAPKQPAPKKDSVIKE